MTVKFTIASCKGGVGKTTITLNVGVSLSKLGVKTLIVDGDIATCALGLKMGLEGVKVGLPDLLSEKETDIEEVIGESFGGVHVLPSGPPSLKSFVRSKIGNLPKVVQKIPEKYDIVLIDSPPGINKNSIAALKAADEVILVTTPELPSVWGAIATKTTSNLFGKKVLGAVINRVSKPKLFGKPFGMKESEVEAGLGTKILGVIPEDLNILKSEDYRKPVVIYKPKSSSSKSFEKIARNILSSILPAKK